MFNKIYNIMIIQIFIFKNISNYCFFINHPVELSMQLEIKRIDQLCGDVPTNVNNAN